MNLVIEISDETYDTISRKAAIDALDKLCDRCEYSKKQRFVMCGACHLGSAFDVIEELPSVSVAEKTGRWIPVSERLPEDGIYLVTVKRTPSLLRVETKSFAKDLHKVDDFSFRKHKCGWYDYDSEYGCWEDKNVIAWMPLPQPYKEESEV